MSDVSDISRLWPGWEPDGLLGTGRFGKVYLAHTRLGGRTVFSAVKIITMPDGGEHIKDARDQGVHPELLRTYFGKFKNDLAWELTMFRTIGAPHAIPADEIAMQDGDGMGWTGYIRTGLYTPVSVYFDKAPSGRHDAVRLGTELCGLLAACEEYGMVHGEIRPENVFVTDEGTFMLSDFGVRRCLEKAGTGIFGITDSEFDAPEVRDGKRCYTASSDIYSLGRLMCWAAWGGSIPKGKSAVRPPNADPEFTEILKKATAKDPKDRYQSAAQLKADLKKLPGEKRAVRRAMAIASAMEAVKRNGGVIRPAPKPDTPEERPKRGILARFFNKTKK